MIILSIVFSILIGIGSFAWGYWQAGFEGLARWAAVFGMFWLAAQWKKWRWVSSLWVVCAVLLAIFGLWFNVNIGWMFSGALFALFAWDLTDFQQKIKLLPAREDAKGLTRRHLMRVSLLALSGLLIAFVLAWFKG